jgi:hypothetical protein
MHGKKRVNDAENRMDKREFPENCAENPAKSVWKATEQPLRLSGKPENNSSRCAESLFGFTRWLSEPLIAQAWA